MKAIVDWLITIEHFAHKFYSEASEYFCDDILLKTFLLHISADEADHYQCMVRASQYLETLPPRKSKINVDDTVKTKIEASFRTVIDLLKNKLISKELLIDFIVETEYSEWNDLFIYVINRLEAEDREFKCDVLRIQHHMRHIEHYLNSSEYGKKKLQSFMKLPYAKKDKILIVDDDMAIVQLLSALLEDICDSDYAANGAEALDMIKTTSYDLIISDVNMPVMNGLELYRNAAPFIVNANENFIYHSGNPTDDHQKFFTANNLTFMTKPSSITQIDRK